MVPQNAEVAALIKYAGCDLKVSVCRGRCFVSYETARYNWNNCYCRPGLCLENLNNDNITNFRWFRYHNGTQKCWHIDQRGPCGHNMIFYRIGETEYGECDCNFYYRCARPLIYWAPEKRCYFTNEKVE